MSFTLKQTLSWTKTLAAASPDAAAELAMLNDLQGNILKGHGRRHTSNLFIAFDPNKLEKAKAFVAEIGKQTTSALDQLTQAQVFKVSGVGANTFISFLLSAKGYEALGQTPAKPTGKAFSEGMSARKELRDPPTSEWDAHLAQDIHGMILVGSVSPEQRIKDRDLLVARIIATGGAVRLLNPQFGEDGDALIHDGRGIEHFGYVDGRSQPLALKEDVEREDKENGGISKWDPAIFLSQLLVRCPGGKLQVSHGSYFVFRKLEQNVRGFKEREAALAEQLEKVHHLPAGAIGERAGASVVGRFENGTPVVLSETEIDPTVPGDAGVPNNFNYKGDPDGMMCPFAGHIRKTNPRTDIPGSKDRLMARRGIPYGLRPNDDPNDGIIENKPTGGVGLLFMAYQSNLEEQFEFTQNFWVNNVDFRNAATGIDPVIGQPPGASKQKWPVDYGKSLSDGNVEDDFSGFVKLRGGEYFFAPSISFLTSLAT